jgi:hypothetical protein
MIRRPRDFARAPHACVRMRLDSNGLRAVDQIDRAPIKTIVMIGADRR